MGIIDYQGQLVEKEKGWTIRLVNGYTGVAQNDTLRFTLDMRIERQNGTVTEDWATSCAVQDGELTGVTSSEGRRFSIQLDSSGQLSCRLPETSTLQRRSAAVALGTLLGALAGAVAGIAAGHTAVGALAGLAAALVGSLVTNAATASYGLRTDSGATWVAEEGNTGGREIGPYTLRAVGA